MSLVSADEMASLREVAELGMTTSCLIYDHAIVETVDGTANTWTPRTSRIKGWLHSKPDQVITLDAGAQGVHPNYRLFLPVGTDVITGDRIEIGGSMFIVSDTDAESTWLPMLTVMLRRVE